MLRRIRDLDLDDLMARVVRATDVGRGRSSDWLIQSALDRTKPADRVRLLRTKVALAALADVQLLEALSIERPLVEALVRVQHHPRDQAPLPKIELVTGVDAGPRLNAITAEHPELPWDIDHVQGLFAQAIREHGDHQLDDALPPWLMNFGKANAAAHTLWTFVTLRALGDLDPNDRDHEARRAAPMREVIQPIGNEAPYLMQLTRLLEERDIPLLPVLSAVTASGTSNMYFAVSGRSRRLQVMLRFLPEALAAVAPNVAVPDVPPHSLLRLFVDGDDIGSAHAVVGQLAARDAVDDVGPAGARDAWARIVEPMLAMSGGTIAARYRFLTEVRGAILVNYPERPESETGLAQRVDDLVSRLGVSAEHRAMWRSIHALMGAGAEFSVVTECTQAGPSPNVRFLYGPAEWDQVIDVVKQTCDVAQARLAAAAFGRLAAAFERVRGLELVLSPDHPPDVLVWLILHPS